MKTINIICDDFDNLGEAAQQGIEAVMAEAPSGITAASGNSFAVKGVKWGKSSLHIKTIDIEQVKQQINDNIVSIVSLIDEKQLAGKDYEVSELEFNLAINGEAKVSLLSVFSAGVSAHSGITVRIRKKK